jgi:tetratricopeptide (TPR) repeat protein
MDPKHSMANIALSIIESTGE